MPLTLPIAADWFARPAEQVAPDLVGCSIVRTFERGVSVRGVIVETEAYGPEDPACHGFRGKTPRNAVMFDRAGLTYVYFIYGRYHCLNVVSDQPGIASAVLIRALWLPQVPDWADWGQVRQPHQIASGPGRLCRALSIDQDFNGMPLDSQRSLGITHRSPDLQTWLETHPQDLVQTTRIGLSKAQDWPWRWYLAGCPAVSRKAVRDNKGGVAKA